MDDNSGDGGLVWSTVRSDAAVVFGEGCGQQIETRLLEAFRSKPEIVKQAIDRVKTMYERGQVRSPWAVVDMNVASALTQIRDGKEPTVDRRETLIKAAKIWTTNAGWDFPLDEYLDDLFGDRGRLRDFDDPGLRAEMTAAWEALQPTADRLGQGNTTAART